MFIAQISYFVSDRMNALIACKPSFIDVVFAVIIDEKWPKFFSLLYKKSVRNNQFVQALKDTGGRGKAQMQELISKNGGCSSH